MMTPSSEKPGEPYSFIRDRIKSLDLILFRGSDLVSTTILSIESKVDKTDAQFSHAGIIIRGEDLAPPEAEHSKKFDWIKPESIYIFESTMSGGLSDGVLNVYGKSFLGVQMRDFDQVVKAYDTSSPKTRLAWLPLKEELRQKVTANPKEYREMLARTFIKYDGMPYDASFIDMAAAASCKCARGVRDSGYFSVIRDFLCRLCCCCCCCKCSKKSMTAASHWLFCSELVAVIYKDMGVLPTTCETQNVMPQDFVPTPNGTKTYDSDKEVPVLYNTLTRFYYA
jgi:hypothetical protein